MKQSLDEKMMFDVFLSAMEEKYEEAWNKNSLHDMMEASAGFCLAYAKMGNQALAQRWAGEFWQRWTNSLDDKSTTSPNP